MSNFENYLITIGKSAKTAKNYAGAISGPISQWAIDNKLIQSPLTEINSLLDFERAAIQIRKLPIYIERNSVGKGMYNAALNGYSTYLSDSKGVHLERDLDEILSNPTTTNTEKKSLVSTRIGQGEFRSLLVEYWKGCAATGYRGTRLLVASHIKPWRKSDDNERLDIYNGLLLTPNLDKAFDLGYIGFRATGKICISPELEEPSVLGVTPELSISLTKRHMPYIDHHLEIEFKN